MWFSDNISLSSVKKMAYITENTTFPDNPCFMLSGKYQRSLNRGRFFRSIRIRLDNHRDLFHTSRKLLQ